MTDLYSDHWGDRVEGFTKEISSVYFKKEKRKRMKKKKKVEKIRYVPRDEDLVRITMRFPNKVIKQLDQRAKKNKMSRNAYITDIVVDFLG